MIPKDVLHETIWSLNLLFPFDDLQTDQYLEKFGMTFHNDNTAIDLRPLDLNDYRHWRERLAALREVYMKKPENLKQMFSKDQSFAERFQFWGTILAGFVLAVVFGTISSVTAIVSTIATVRGLDVSRESLRLARDAFEL